MDKDEAVGVLKTLIDFQGSSYVIEALEMSIKSLQSDEPAQHVQNITCPLRGALKCKHAVVELRCRAKRGHEKQWEECSGRLASVR